MIFWLNRSKIVSLHCSNTSYLTVLGKVTDIIGQSRDQEEPIYTVNCFFWVPLRLCVCLYLCVSVCVWQEVPRTREEFLFVGKTIYVSACINVSNIVNYHTRRGLISSCTLYVLNFPLLDSLTVNFVLNFPLLHSLTVILIRDSGTCNTTWHKDYD